MAERQIDRIRKAEEAVRELVKVAAQLRCEVDKLPLDDLDTRSELLQAAEGFETQAKDLQNSLREWRQDIN